MVWWGSRGLEKTGLMHLLHTYSNTPELLTELESLLWTVWRQGPGKVVGRLV